MAFVISLTIFNGALIGLQGIVNAGLGLRIGPMQGTFVNHLVGGLVAGALLLAGLHTGHLHFHGVPFHYFLGGCLGVVALVNNNYAIPRVGASVVTLILIIAQLGGSALIDALGLFGATASALHAHQWAGLLLLAAGTTCVAWPTKQPPPESSY